MKNMQKAEIKPLSNIQAWGYFLMFGILFCSSFYFVTPIFEEFMPSFYAYMLSLDICFILMLLFTFIALKKDKNSRSVWQRMNYHKIDKTHIVLLMCVFAIEMIVFFLINFLNEFLIEYLYIFPSYLPAFADPRVLDVIDIIDIEVGLSGNYFLLLLTTLTLVLNVIAEEFLWRGYILERQKLANVKHLWIIHGVMWTIFHFYKFYDLIIILPISLGLSYAVVKTDNNTPGIIYHLLTNGTTVITIGYFVLFT